MGRRKYIYLSLVFFIAFVVTYLIHPNEVTCIPVSCSSFSKNIQSDLLNSPMFLVNSKVSSYIKENSWIDSVQTNVTWTGKVNLQMKLKDSDIGIKADGQSQISLYMKNGEYVASSESFDGPIIYAKSNFDVGNTPFIASLSYEIFNLLPVSQISVVNDSLEVQTKDGYLVKYPLSGDIDLLLGETIVSFSQLNGSPEKFNIIGEDGKTNKVKEIDFRFERPVLK